MKRWPLGLALPHFQQIHGPKALTIAAPRAEALGWDSIGVTDHIVLPDVPHAKRFGEVFYDPFVTLTWAAAVTQTLALGTSLFSWLCRLCRGIAAYLVHCVAKATKTGK